MDASHANERFVCEHTTFEERLRKRQPPLLARDLFREWGLIDLPLRAAFSPAHPLADIFTRPSLRLLRNRFPETCQ